LGAASFVPSPAEISVIICSYERPWHLRRCLLSLAAQRGVTGQFEVIVVDDGSRDETPQVVDSFAAEVDFPVRFITHPHEGFQQARCRNEGILAAKAPYLLFTDGDCLFPPDHLRQQLAARRPNVARAGDCFRIDRSASEAIDEAAVRSGAFLDRVAPAANRWLRPLYRKALLYQLLRNRVRPKLIGWNMAMWRSDAVRVNGFDQKFRAWSCEDDDLAARLRASGVRVLTALGYTHGYHLWHAPHSTTPQAWRDGPNVPYLLRPVRLITCLDGLRRRSLADLSVRVLGCDDDDGGALVRGMSTAFQGASCEPDIEVLVWPSRHRFSRGAACRVLVEPRGQKAPPWVKRAAHAVISNCDMQDVDGILREVTRLIEGPPTASKADAAACSVA